MARKERRLLVLALNKKRDQRQQRCVCHMPKLRSKDDAVPAGAKRAVRKYCLLRVIEHLSQHRVLFYEGLIVS